MVLLKVQCNLKKFSKSKPLPNTTTIDIDNLHLKGDFNSNEETTYEDISHLLESNNPHEGRLMRKATITCKMGSEEMTNDDSHNLHSQSNGEPHHQDLVSTKLHPSPILI